MSDHAAIGNDSGSLSLVCVPAKGHYMATKERLAAMAASLCALCSGAMVIKLIAPDPNDRALELRTYMCAECGHSQTYSVNGGGS